MKHKQASILFGTAVSAAAIAVAIDHSRHRLPEPEKQVASQAVIIIDEGEEMPADNMDDCNRTGSSVRPAAPCSL